MIPRKSLEAIAAALEGLPVLGVLPGTPAARAGVRYGDVVLSVNGRRTRTVADYVEAKDLDPKGMIVVVFRSGEAATHTLAYDRSAHPPDPLRLLVDVAAMRIVDPGDGEPGGGGSPS